MPEPQSTHDLKLVTPLGTFEMASDMELGKDGVFKPPNMELTPKQHKLFAKLNRCACLLCKEFDGLTSLHIDTIPE